MPIAGFEDVIYPRSIVEHSGATYFLYTARDTGRRQLGIIGDSHGFAGTELEGALLCPCSAENAAALRARLPWLNPGRLGLNASFGFGDRLGSATAGQIQALRASGAEAHIAPIFAQQSVRENTRTGRTPQQVLDDAMWGVLQEGWRAPWAADADHVKEIADLAPFVAAGYTFYTIDPSDYVDNEAQSDTPDALRDKVARLPWEKLATTYEALRRHYCSQPISLGEMTLQFDEIHLLRALAKYGRAIAHTADIAAALAQQMRGTSYELELSVDETDTPTSAHEHFFIARELSTRNIPLVSLAPRFVGKFQKGVDYMGDLATFEEELARHVAIMRHFGSYKLSVHTGSDKFKIYPILARHVAGQVHIKTAGTSYLEALRIVADRDPDLFRGMLDHARARFGDDRKTYALDARLEQVPEASALSAAALPGLLEQFDARQVLHVTFGSILAAYGAELHACIHTHQAQYAAGLERHFSDHLAPFVQPGATQS